MKKLHVYSLNPDSGYGGELRINNLAFYKKDNTKLEVTNIVHVNDNEATFKLSGVNGRIRVPLPYVNSDYYVDQIFTTPINVYSTVMIQNNNGATHENKGFWIYLDKDVSVGYITLAYHYTNPKNFVLEADDGPPTEPVNASQATIFKLPLPARTIRCLLGKNGHHYFLRKKEVSTTEVRA